MHKYAPRHSKLSMMERLRYRAEIRNMLNRVTFSHAITLATNDPMLSASRLLSHLRRWDAIVNRKLNGPKWAKRPDERLLWFAFPEKLDRNPHWHLLAQVDPTIEPHRRSERTEQLPAIAQRSWGLVCPSGSFDCQALDPQPFTWYATKGLLDEENLERFVFSREFERMG